jgi:hypothetical protein
MNNDFLSGRKEERENTHKRKKKIYRAEERVLYSTLP